MHVIDLRGARVTKRPRFSPTAHKALRIILWLVVAVLAIVALNMHAANADAARNAGALAYESCIKQEYGMTPTAYYNEAGVWPEC